MQSQKKNLVNLVLEPSRCVLPSLKSNRPFPLLHKMRPQLLANFAKLIARLVAKTSKETKLTLKYWKYVARNGKRISTHSDDCRKIPMMGTYGRSNDLWVSNFIQHLLIVFFPSSSQNLRSELISKL